MATNILMPALSPTMTEGTLARWLKKEGDTVKAGDIIAEIETDKATMEVEAVDEGMLGKILVADGTEGVKVNATIAVLVEEGEAVPTRRPRRQPAEAAQAAAGAQTPALAGGAGAAGSRQRRRRPGGAEPAADAAPRRNGHDGGDRVFVSPLAGAWRRRPARPRRHQRQRPGRPHREVRHRGGAEQAGRRQARAGPGRRRAGGRAAPPPRRRSPPRPPSPRRIPRCRTAASARSSPGACRNRSRPSRIST